MHHYQWSVEKNERLKSERGLCFEQVVRHVEGGDLLDVYEHRNQGRYPGRRFWSFTSERMYAWCTLWNQAKAAS